MTKEKDLMWLYMAICKAQIRYISDEKVSALLEIVATKVLSIMMEPSKRLDELELTIIRKYVY